MTHTGEEGARKTSFVGVLRGICSLAYQRILKGRDVVLKQVPGLIDGINVSLIALVIRRAVRRSPLDRGDRKRFLTCSWECCARQRALRVD